MDRGHRVPVKTSPYLERLDELPDSWELQREEPTRGYAGAASARPEERGAGASALRLKPTR